MRKNKKSIDIKNKVDNIYLSLKRYKKGASYNDIALINKIVQGS